MSFPRLDFVLKYSSLHSPCLPYGLKLIFAMPSLVAATVIADFTYCFEYVLNTCDIFCMRMSDMRLLKGCYHYWAPTCRILVACVPHRGGELIRPFYLSFLTPENCFRAALFLFFSLFLFFFCLV